MRNSFKYLSLTILQYKYRIPIMSLKYIIWQLFLSD